MKRALRWTCIGVLIVGIAAGVLYEASTHVGRGWLRGEAFYDGRPTSFWREQIDGWVARFDSRDDAERFLRFSSPISSSLPIPPKPTLWGQICISLHLPGLRTDAEIPRVLIADTNAEAVWRELEATPAYASLVAQARRDSPFFQLFRARN